MCDHRRWPHVDVQFVAADWGTTHLRAYLAERDASGTVSVVDRRTGPGITSIEPGEFADCLWGIVADWITTGETTRVLVSGMASSTIGWAEVPYVDCPTDAAGIAAATRDVAFGEATATLVGGVRCTNPLGLADVMRGEELQTFGALPAATADAIVVLPGTHNKWVYVRNGEIVHFLTALTGELFALLNERSVLVPDVPQVFDANVFDVGLAAIRVHGPERLLNLLFSTRSRQLSGELPPEHSAAYVSGLLIGADVAAGLAAVAANARRPQPIFVVGDAPLSEHYVRALAHFDVSAETVASTTATLGGYGQLMDASKERQ